MTHLHLVVSYVFVALIAFGLGRVKNSEKLARIATSLDFIEAKASQEVKSVVAAIRAHL